VDGILLERSQEEDRELKCTFATVVVLVGRARTLLVYSESGECLQIVHFHIKAWGPCQAVRMHFGGCWKLLLCPGTRNSVSTMRQAAWQLPP
jgi:hypothetical protein